YATLFRSLELEAEHVACVIVSHRRLESCLHDRGEVPARAACASDGHPDDGCSGFDGFPFSRFQVDPFVCEGQKVLLECFPDGFGGSGDRGHIAYLRKWLTVDLSSSGMSPLLWFPHYEVDQRLSTLGQKRAPGLRGEPRGWVREHPYGVATFTTPS